MSGSRRLSRNEFLELLVVGPAETLEQQVDGGWPNEDAVVHQLERPVYIAYAKDILSKLDNWA